MRHLQKNAVWEPDPGKMICFHALFLVLHLPKNTFWEPALGKDMTSCTFLDTLTEAEYIICANFLQNAVVTLVPCRSRHCSQCDRWVPLRVESLQYYLHLFLLILDTQIQTPKYNGIGPDT